MSVAELVTKSCSDAEKDLAWLGSDNHLQVLTETLADLRVEEDVTLEWGPPRAESHWIAARRTIVIERPEPTDDPEIAAELAKDTALVLLHESLHSRFSTPSSFAVQKRQLLAPLQSAAEYLFNLLEDERVARLAIQDQAELKDPLDEIAHRAVQRLEHRSGTSGSGSTPEFPSSQLMFAVMAYAVSPSHELVLHPEVAAKLEELRPIVDGTRDVASTDKCVAPAIELVAQTSEFRLSSPPD